MSLAYRLLGPLEAHADHGPVDLGAPKQRIVLACLLLERNRVVPADRLTSVVWGEDPPPSSMSSLQVYISNLRRVLRDPTTGVAPLRRQAPGYVLHTEGAQVDLDVFARLAAGARTEVAAGAWERARVLADEGAGLWRGPLLSDLGLPAWLHPEARAWDDQRLDLGCLHVTALLGAGHVSEALARARSLAAEDPFRDDVCRLLLLALHRCGRTAEALETYTAYAERLADELGIDPSPDLRSTQLALLRQETWASRWPLPATAGPAPASTRPASVSPPPAPDEPAPVETPVPRGGDLVGREPQLRTAARLVDDVLAGRPRWLVLTGPAGIGKTRLAEEVLARVEHSGGRTVRGRCLEEEGSPAWWPLRQVIRDLGADPDVVLRAPADAEADSARFAVYDRVRALLLEAAADRPLAVLVDDLQWSDATSLSCLASLATSLGTGRVLVVVTVRDVEGGADVRRTAAALLRGEGARQVVVPPLSADDVAALAGQVAGERLPHHEAVGLAERTGGNALFVCEYARLSPDERADGEVPLAVRAVLGRRLESLDAAALQVLRAAAVVGDGVDIDLLSRVTRLDREDLVDLLDDAADAHIIAARPGSGYVFSHALLREEVLAGISPVRTQRLHAAVAAALETAGGERLTRRAQHLLAAGPLADARELLEACRAAALQAEERWSSETAVDWWRSAREALDRLPESEQDPQERDDLLVFEVEALARAGRGQTLLDVVDAGILDAQRTGRTASAGRLAASLVRAAGTWPWVTFGQDPGPVLTRLSGLTPFVAYDPAARARVLAAQAVGHCYDDEPGVPENFSTLALELAESTGDPEVLADALLGRVLTYVGVASHAHECEELLARLTALPRARGEVDAVTAHSVMTMSRILSGDVVGAQEHLRLGVAGADLLRLPTVRVQLRLMEVGLVQWRQGPQAALAKVAEAVAAWKRIELYEAGFAEVTTLLLAWDSGTLADQPESEGPDFEPVVWAAARAAARGHRARAAALVDERLAQRGPVLWHTLAHETVLAHLVADLELTRHVEDLLARLGPHAGRLAGLGQGPIAGPVDLALARLHQLAGDRDAALTLAVSARNLAERNGGARWAERCEALVEELAAWGE